MQGTIIFIINNFNYVVYYLAIVLVQLILKAISILEKIGAKINGKVSDGAATNRKVWKEFRVTRLKHNFVNSIIHPMDNKRKIYLFLDAPHLIKSVRNRLLNVKYLKVRNASLLNHTISLN